MAALQRAILSGSDSFLAAARPEALGCSMVSIRRTSPSSSAARASSVAANRACARVRIEWRMRKGPDVTGALLLGLRCSRPSRTLHHSPRQSPMACSCWPEEFELLVNHHARDLASRRWDPLLRELRRPTLRAETSPRASGESSGSSSHPPETAARLWSELWFLAAAAVRAGWSELREHAPAAQKPRLRFYSEVAKWFSLE